MKVFNPNNSSHKIAFIPRFKPIGICILAIRIEGTDLIEIQDVEPINKDGIYTVGFNTPIAERERGEITIKNEDKILYRGKYIATYQASQEFKQTQDYYEWQ